MRYLERRVIILPRKLVEKSCKICGRRSKLISESIGVCVDCLRSRPDEALTYAEESHRRSRMRFNLPPQPPKTPGGIRCGLCSADCIIGEGGVGYCGLRRNKGGRLESMVDSEHGLLHYYLDAHVTNCCAAWFCPAGTGAGYPEYAARNGPEYGYYNLALFFYGCSFDCLFCQNWSHKRLGEGGRVSASELVKYTLADSRITCWCWFGGSPEPQLPFAINASKRILEEKPENRIMRICFEWNGCGDKSLVKKAGELAYISGGNIKFDLKAYTPSVHKALTGRDNKRTFENFELVYREFYERRRGLPVLNATTLLVPHYVDEYEVSRIAEFIASLDPEIPYSLLIFHPDYLMSDVTITPRSQVERCYQAAKKYLKNVHIGNIALLGLAEAEL
ncbi:MAG: radical SAM protein [Thaumarchaeota archaeon]|nr:radical SAM protein [Nitrososphaerota archaeon]